MFQNLINWIYPQAELVQIELKPLKINRPAPEPAVLDRNYHHYTITEHTQQRMKERKISYSEINMALKYGEETSEGVILHITEIPESEFAQMSNADIKAITYLLPLTVILNKKDKVVKTVYQTSKTFLKEKVVADVVKKGMNNRYSRKIESKCRDEVKQKRKLAKKLRPYKEIEDEC